MSDNSSNPLDGLPTPQKAAKPSPLKSDPGHQPQQGERWWLQRSINPEAEEPEAPEAEETGDTEQDQQETVAEATDTEINTYDGADATPKVSEMDQIDEDETPNGSSNLPMIIGLIVVIGLVAAFMLSGGES